MSKLPGFALLALLLASACKKDVREPGTPVEIRPPHSTYTPAFPGQTRIAGVRTETAWSGAPISTELAAPWGITSLPDGRLLITQKAGTLRIATTTGSLGASISGLPAVASDGQGGLLDIIADAQFAQNRTLYWTFAEAVSGGTVTAVGKGQLSTDEQRVENASVIYRALPAFNGTGHYGSRILETPEGYLLVTTGERIDLSTRVQAQDLSSALGKVLRITKDGGAAPGNPFVLTPNARPEIYTLGHRNVQGIRWHANGSLWISEMGPLGGDELNLLQAGKNYGWPVICYGLEYSGDPVGGGITQHNGMEQPVYYWDPSVSPCGMTFHNGNNFPEWKDNLFIGALSGTHIIRLVLENNRVTGEERLLENEGQRFRAITQGTDGALYAITDAGRLYRIARR
jgi:glucose/arabinose dehydrogenase